MTKYLGSGLLMAALLLGPITTRAQDEAEDTQADDGAEPAEDSVSVEAEPEPVGAAPADEGAEPADDSVAAPTEPGYAGSAAPAGQGAAPQPQPADAGPPPRTDGVRFRGAIAAAGGGEFASGFEFGLGGVEGRAGVQFSDLIALYLQSSLSFGAGSVGGVNGFTGTASATVLVDFTIADYFFVAAGGGIGLLNNPWGPGIHVRVGGYPAVGFAADGGPERRGLMLGVDARVWFLDGGISGLLPVAQIMGSIGYEVF